MLRLGRFLDRCWKAQRLPQGRNHDVFRISQLSISMRITSTCSENALMKTMKAKLNIKAFNARSSRFSHTDLKWPDFSKDRRSSVKDATVPVLEGSYTRKVLSYLPVAASLTAGLYATKEVTMMFITSMSPAKDVLALAQVEVNISSIPVGQMMTVKWRGRPLFIKHRLQSDVQVERQTPLSALRHPERDEDRVIKDEWLVMIGICTHLGCVPISNAGDYNAFYCPCHGSHYDHSGRIRKGPAPTNMEIPPYVFLNDDTILVG